MTPSPAAAGPRVGLAVEPRLLRDALEAALERNGVTIVDLRDGAACDILLTSDGDRPSGGATVVQVDEAASTTAGPVSLTRLLAIIDQWAPHPGA